MIAIKGMEMPKSCWGCPMVTDTLTGLDCQLIGDVWDCSSNRHKECPLVEVEKKNDSD